MTPSLYSAVAGGPYGERQLMQVRPRATKSGYFPIIGRAQNRAICHHPAHQPPDLDKAAHAGANLLTPLQQQDFVL